MAKVSDVASYIGFGWEYATREREYLKWSAAVFLLLFVGLALAVGVVAASFFSLLAGAMSFESLVASAGAAIVVAIVLVLVVVIGSSYWNVVLVRGAVSKARGRDNRIAAMRAGAWGMTAKLIGLSIVLGLAVFVIDFVLGLVSPVLAEVVGWVLGLFLMFAAYALVTGDRGFLASISRSVDLVAANPVTAVATFVAAIVAVLVFAVIGLILGVILGLIAVAAAAMGGVGLVIAVVVGIILAIFALFALAFITLFNTGAIAALYAALDAETGAKRVAAVARVSESAAPARRLPVRRAASKPVRRSRK